jgi:hypothetical protein
MNPMTGEIFEGEEAARRLAAGEPLVEVSPKVAQLVRDGVAHQKHKASRRAREKAARAARRTNRRR